MRSASSAVKLRKQANSNNKSEEQWMTKVAYSIRVMLAHLRIKFSCWLKLVSKHGRRGASETNASSHPPGLQQCYVHIEDAAPSTPVRRLGLRGPHPFQR
eukprot:7866022-Pyramimonas_sp.AAC.1